VRVRAPPNSSPLTRSRTQGCLAPGGPSIVRTPLTQCAMWPSPTHTPLAGAGHHHLHHHILLLLLVFFVCRCEQQRRHVAAECFVAGVSPPLLLSLLRSPHAPTQRPTMPDERVSEIVATLFGGTVGEDNAHENPEGDDDDVAASTGDQIAYEAAIGAPRVAPHAVPAALPIAPAPHVPAAAAAAPLAAAAANAPPAAAANAPPAAAANAPPAAAANAPPANNVQRLVRQIQGCIDVSCFFAKLVLQSNDGSLLPAMVRKIATSTTMLALFVHNDHIILLVPAVDHDHDDDDGVGDSIVIDDTDANVDAQSAREATSESELEDEDDRDPKRARCGDNIVIDLTASLSEGGSEGDGGGEGSGLCDAEVDADGCIEV
jgi:hypothetical protein